MRARIVPLLVAVAALSSATPAVQAQKQSMPLEQPDDPPLVESINRPHIPTGGMVSYAKGPWISIQVNTDEFGFNIPGDAANEPSIAIDPTDSDVVVIGWRQFDTIESNFRQAGWAYSADGGDEWTFPGVIQPGVFRSDPVLDSAPNGDIYYYSLRGDFFCQLFVSSNGGISWSGPIDAYGGDKAWFIVDQTGSVGDGNLYVAWSTAGNNYFPNQFSKSTDSGSSFDDPVELTPQRQIWGTLATDDQGDLYVSGQDNGNIYVSKSTNAKIAGQATVFDSTTEVDLNGMHPGIGGDPNPGGLLGQVWVAADTSGGATAGNIYVLCSVNPPGSDPLDVMFARSTDGGQTFDAPLKVNDEGLGVNAWQWFATMAVAPNGRIDVIFNDTRHTGQANLSELVYSFSTDGGQSFSVNMPVSQVFNSHLGWPDQNKIGDYYDMISSNAEARIAYSATFNGEQDVYYLEVGDCNDNGVHDSTDIGFGSSTDYNEDLIPDDCQCLADINASGDVNVIDLLELLGDWGPCPDCPADIDRDGEVSVLDLLILLAAWGSCP